MNSVFSLGKGTPILKKGKNSWDLSSIPLAYKQLYNPEHPAPISHLTEQFRKTKIAFLIHW